MSKSVFTRLAFIPLCLGLLLCACDNGNEAVRHEEKSPSVQSAQHGSTSRQAEPQKEMPVQPEAVRKRHEQQKIEQQTKKTSELPKSTHSSQFSKTGQEDNNQVAKQKNTEPMPKEKADKLLAFRNNAVGIFTAGYYALPEILRHNSDIYKMTWQLPPGPRIKGKKRDAKALEPGGALFDKQDETTLTRAFLDMDKALQNMLTHYRALEKYVKDDSIRDDGKNGRLLAKNLEHEHSVFLKARHTWLDIVEARAKEAEAALLAGHPLERQIGAAQKMLAQVREVANIIKSGNTDKNIIAPICQNIGTLLENAAKPPFPAAPAIERVYRTFLKRVTAYAAVLSSALDEGFYAPQKRELVDAMNKCLIAYNEFARAANFQLLTRSEAKGSHK